jgi:hypothetical protein
MTQIEKIEIVDLSQEFFREWDQNKPLTLKILKIIITNFRTYLMNILNRIVNAHQKG